MNNISIIGTMTRDVELKYLSSGLSVGSFAIAVNQDYKKQDGTKVEKTSFFDIKVIGKQSETINSFFNKGSRIGISGELEQETWKAQDGTNRSRVVIKLNSFTFIDRKSDNQSNNGQTNNNSNNVGQQQYNAPQQQQQQTNYNAPQQQYQPPQNNIPTIDIDNDIIPF